jgi:hypothetical protein
MKLQILAAMAVALAATPSAFGAAVYTSLAPGTNSLARNDDGSSPSTQIFSNGAAVNFFGTSYTNLFVNNNGNVTFNNPLATFTPFGLTTNTGIPIIAAFFGDVDTRGAASAILTFGSSTFTTNDSVNRNVFVANWLGVGYFSTRTDLLNTFQMVLVDRSETGAGNFDIVFNYDTINWETGGASGGTNGLGGNSARVGYSRGTGVSGTFAEFAGSGVNGAFLDNGPLGTALIHNTNVLPTDTLYTRIDGRYVLTVRNGAVSGVPEVPEPTTFALAGSTLLVLGYVRRKRTAKV